MPTPKIWRFSPFFFILKRLPCTIYNVKLHLHCTSSLMSCDLTVHKDVCISQLYFPAVYRDALILKLPFANNIYGDRGENGDK